MKTKIFALSILVCGALGFSSCKKGLDLEPNDRLTDQQLWSNQSLVLMYTNNFYSQLPSEFNGVISSSWLLSSLTDDAMVSSTSTSSSSARGIANQLFDANNSPLTSTWNNRYTYIRRANLYLQNIDNVPGDQQLNVRLKAEVRFLRAYYYYDLVQWFGGVPLITTAQNYDDPDLFRPRNTIDECYDFLTSELDLAANDLPSSYSTADAGRITKQAAMALKCRVQMLKKDWTSAAATAKAIMDLGKNSLLANYTSVFTTPAATNTEVILSVQHNNNKDERGTQFDLNTMSPYYGGSGSNCPTQNLVDDYEMKTTGKAITDPTSGYDPTKPYLNRDPRFDATILYDNAVFKSRNMQMYTGGQDVTPNTGLGITTDKISPTGYYLKKFTNESLNIMDANVRSSYNWPLIRYAEVLLNYAEAQNEAVGADPSVYNAINAVRQRAGMPVVATGLDQAQMRNVIRHERRIELAFEGFRYWDAKRWKTAEQWFSSTTNPIKKATITYVASTNTRTYDFTKTVTYNRSFLAKHYLFPIPQAEMIKPGSKLTQNSGWEL
ncbi:RagB/SusD family nutrient uptake outer membrane protein [Solitalea koreensis]|uniref:Starch-binding associating with outer membrane n=1 Tax=Solitalea koreensis TaxID=543615 RepID=A0A521C2Q5_9SPHI|nr:RagB/SusD family nutrient uptake outer membrane protein [Solitalea koreensis]SMO53742.1 Starch-binding associating with outer membrane [Solitalea koreensis]